MNRIQTYGPYEFESIKHDSAIISDKTQSFGLVEPSRSTDHEVSEAHAGAKKRWILKTSEILGSTNGFRTESIISQRINEKNDSFLENVAASWSLKDVFYKNKCLFPPHFFSETGINGDGCDFITQALLQQAAAVPEESQPQPKKRRTKTLKNIGEKTKR